MLFSFVSIIKNVNRILLLFFILSFLLILSNWFFLNSASSRYRKGFIFFIILHAFLNLVFVHLNFTYNFINIFIIPIINRTIWVFLFIFFLSFLNFFNLNRLFLFVCVFNYLIILIIVYWFHDLLFLFICIFIFMFFIFNHSWLFLLAFLNFILLFIYIFLLNKTLRNQLCSFSIHSCFLSKSFFTQPQPFWF